MQLDDPACDEESQAKAGRRGTGLLELRPRRVHERIKEMGEKLRVDADAGVADNHLKREIGAASLDRDGPARWRVSHRVEQELRHCLMEAINVEGHAA